MQTDEV